MITALDRAPELAKYELIERIGLGGMATVYRARDRRLGREVAVKLIHAHLRENVEVAARFVSEAKAVARLRHPNVVEVFDVSDENEPERYLVVELVRGTTLRALVSRHRVLPPELAAAIGLEVAAGLAHAHREGIVHRDVKPENVLVDLSAGGSTPSATRGEAQRPKIKLTDFGIAKLLDAQGVTSTGQVLGSPAHMAPEQIEGGDVGPRADVFALGVMLYECMVGRLPFDGKNPAQVLRRVLEGVYPPAVREEPRVGAAWSALLDRALARDPSGRWESIDAFALAIREQLASVGVADPRSEIDRFLENQDGYGKELEPRLVEGLVSAGESARTRGDFGLAAVFFNRALVYRPGDADLVRRVTRIAARVRWHRAGRVALAVVLAAGAFTAGAVWLGRGPVVRILPRSAARALATAEKKTGQAAAAAPSAGAMSPKREERPAAPPRPPPVLTAAPVMARPKPPAETRRVKVDVVGPKGGYVKIDGTPKDVFIQEHLLSIGPHTFEFVPSDPECCLPPPPATRDIVEGASPDELQRIPIVVGFKDARLRVRSPEAKLRCPTLFGGDRPVPGVLDVPMSRLTVSGTCTLSADAATLAGLAGPLSKEVTLNPGQTTDVSWP